MLGHLFSIRVEFDPFASNMCPEPAPDQPGWNRVTIPAHPRCTVPVDAHRHWLLVDKATPYTDNAIDLSTRIKISISLTVAVGAATLRISDTTNGLTLALWQNIQFPPGWSFTGTFKPAVVYYGIP
jgi:hypothetical protein